MSVISAGDRTAAWRSISMPLARIQRRAPVAQLVALLVVYAYGAATISGFGAWSNVKSMLVLGALLSLAALGQTLVVILGGLDLSVPGFIVMGSFVVYQLYGGDGWPGLAAIGLPLAIAAGMGATTGWLCHRYRLQPLVVTLGMGGIAAGGAVAWTQGNVAGSAPAFLTSLTSPATHTFGIDVPPIVLTTVLVTVALAVVLHRTVVGRRLYATGANPRAASLAGIRTGRVWVAVFAASAVSATIVGILLAGYSGPDQSIGDPYLFEGLTAVIVGGTTIMGAHGDYTHTVLGALILTFLTTILVGHNVGPAANQIIFGALILLVVAGYGRDRRLRDRI
jgi:ribose transport system permease protein